MRYVLRRKFLSTLSLRRATKQKQHKGAYKNISIHALLAESDIGYQRFKRDRIVISIHALLAESDNKSRDSITIRPTFLSTLSLRRATLLYCLCSGAGQISIHALLAESDHERGQENNIQEAFLSTLSLRRATGRYGTSTGVLKFLSTLSLRRATNF